MILFILEKGKPTTPQGREDTLLLPLLGSHRCQWADGKIIELGCRIKEPPRILQI